MMRHPNVVRALGFDATLAPVQCTNCCSYRAWVSCLQTLLARVYPTPNMRLHVANGHSAEDSARRGVASSVGVACYSSGLSASAEIAVRMSEAQ